MESIARIKEPFNLIIFGASGELAKLKLFPSIYDLALQRRLPAHFNVMGFGRTAKTQKEFRKEFKESVKEAYRRNVDTGLLESLLPKFTYISGQYNEPQGYESMASQLWDLNNKIKYRTLVYLSVPPVVFHPVIEEVGRIQDKLGGDVHLVIEKPFGVSEASSAELLHHISKFFKEEQIFLLDHYLGKEAVQSILNLRIQNSILDHLLDGRFIDHIQITAQEDVGVEQRIRYFDQVGIVRDMIQSHLLQVLALLAMDLPVDRNAESLHREKQGVLQALSLPRNECNVVLGQYAGYHKPGVKSGSATETFAAIRCFIDRNRWYNVPIYLRAGKKLSHKHTYVVIQFKPSAAQERLGDSGSNRLLIELFPHEKLEIHLLNQHGDRASVEKMITAESLACSGDDCLSPHARLMMNALLKNRCYFISPPEVLAAWRFIDKVFACIQKHRVPVRRYKPGTNGPQDQQDLPAKDGHEWYHLDD